MKVTSTSGKSLIKHYESLHDGDLSVIGLQPKKCPAGIWTIGWGHALRKSNGEWITNFSDIKKYWPEYLTINEEKANELLDADLNLYESKVNSLDMFFTQNQFDAIVSFSYNCGFASFKGSTLFKRIFSGVGDIAEAFGMWNKVDGEPVRGLTLRRESEAELYLTV